MTARKPRTPRFNPWVGKIPWKRAWQPTPVLLPGKFHGQRSLVGCSPWGHEELDMTEWLHFHFSLSQIGEGNGNPLQCPCLVNPMNGGAWWAAVYVVTESRTRLKQLCSSIYGCENWTIKKAECRRIDAFELWCWRYHYERMLLLLLLLSLFSRVQLCEPPQMAAHWAPWSLGLFRPEHWSGLPFPSPICESEKWKWSRSVVSDS